MKTEINALADRYFEAPTPARRERLIMGCIPLIRSIIRKIMPPRTILTEREDLEGIGLLSMIEAIERFDPERGTTFVSYAYVRIYGGITDYLRTVDVLTRGERKEIARLEKALDLLSQQQGEPPEDQEVADFLGISVDNYARLKQHRSRRFSRSLDVYPEDGTPLQDSLADAGAEAAFDHVEYRIDHDVVLDMIQQRPGRKWNMMRSYYTENRSQREIADEMQITEARVCQILGRARQELRGQLDRVPYTSAA